MDVRTYEALSMKDALRRIRRDLGADAIIISSKEKPFPGHETGKLIEVTAARPGAEAAVGPPTVRSSDGAVDPRRLEGIESELTHIVQLLIDNPRVARLERSVEELRALVSDAVRGEHIALRQIPDELGVVAQTLRSAGVFETEVIRVIKHIESLPLPQGFAEREPGRKLTHFKVQAAKILARRIKIAVKDTTTQRRQIDVFIGPTGAGKTTLTAKVAAALSPEARSHAVVLSLDTLRLAASEQLRIYAKIIGAEFVALRNVEDLGNAIAVRPATERFLLDTSGQSIRSSPDIALLKELGEAQIPCRYHLVLSATERFEHMDRAVCTFAELGLASIAFCKLDETSACGDIINLQSKWDIPLSFFSDSPKVPGGVERATRERVVENIVGI